MTQRRSVLALLAVGSAAALVATGCGSSDGDDDTASAATTEATQEAAPSPTPTPSEDAAVDETETLTAYFGGLDELSEEGAAVMAENASPGSPAALYAGYWAETQRTPSSYESQSRVDGDSVVSTVIEDDGTRSTTTYTDLEFDEKGLLVTWTSDPGGPLAPRIAEMDQTSERDAMAVEFSYAYESNGGALVMPVRVVNDREDSGQVAVFTYVQPSGEQLEGRTFGVTTTPFFAEVEGGAFLYDVLYVEDGELGGTVLLEFDNDVPNPERAEVPTAQGTA